MVNKFNLSWLKIFVGSTSLFYIAAASILSCLIIYYFFSGLLAFLIFSSVLFGKKSNLLCEWLIQFVIRFSAILFHPG